MVCGGLEEFEVLSEPSVRDFNRSPNSEIM